MISPPPAFGRARPAAKGAPLPAKLYAPGPEASVTPPVGDPDDELEAWKQSRKRRSFPWRQFSLMLSLCFAVASWVLPDSVNDTVNYILYALAAISFFNGLRGRRKKPS